MAEKLGIKLLDLQEIYQNDPCCFVDLSCPKLQRSEKVGAINCETAGTNKRLCFETVQTRFELLGYKSRCNN